jgi:anti-sigma regulatory factor (Ser/Thr protein kinase)
VHGAIERLTEAMGFPAVQSRPITRAVDEALTNIVRHSYGNRLDQPVALYFRRAQRTQHREVERGLAILPCDRGSAAGLNKLQGRPFEQIRPGGLGLQLIRQAMDTVEFTRKGLTNRLRLAKYLPQTSDAP